MERIKVLLIEDNPPDAVFIEEMLAEGKDFSFDLEWKEKLSIGLECLAKKGIDVVLLDLNLPDSKDFNTFTKTLAQAPEKPIIILTGLDDETLAIRAVRTGAQDYLIKKHVNSSLLVRTIRYAIARRMGEEKHFTIQDVTIEPGTVFEHTINRVFAYVIEGNGYFDTEKKSTIGKEHLVIFKDGDYVKIASNGRVLRFLLISGKSLSEPIAWRGPIVMNTQEELQVAFDEYRNGTFIKHKT